MDEDTESPAITISMNEEIHRKILALNKKRKLESEVSSQPIAKHKCYDQTLLLPNCESEDGGSHDGSNPESANGSNSFMIEDTDSAISALYGLYPHQSGDAKSNTNGKTSGCSSGWPENQMDSSDGKLEENIELLPDGPINIRKFLEEELLELGNIEYGHDSMEQCADNESEVDNYSSGGSQKSYILSSGRWNIEQESLQRTRTPTIDQEFEQYFSTLML